MLHDIIQPLTPQFPADWLGGEDIRHLLRSVYPCRRYFHPRLRIMVLSAVEVAVDTDEVSRGPEYHLSVTKQIVMGRPERCSAEEGQWVLEQFGLDGWEEDNHTPQWESAQLLACRGREPGRAGMRLQSHRA